MILFFIQLQIIEHFIDRAISINVLSTDPKKSRKNGIERLINAFGRYERTFEYLLQSARMQQL